MGGGWGEPRGPRLESIAGTTGEVEEARSVLAAMGVKGGSLADQAIAAARELGAARAALAPHGYVLYERTADGGWTTTFVAATEPATT